jgi:hypothetical protein
MNLDHLDGFTLKHLAHATRNGAFIEEYRRRNCVNRYDEIADCACWACERYGLGAYYDFQCHPDGDYPEHCLADGLCWCWVCAMARKSREDNPHECD